jgi:hypothetical protein
VTLIETTEGVTSAAIDLTSIEEAPSETKVRDEMHLSLAAKYITCVFLSTQALTPIGSELAAVATPPMAVAPNRNPTPTFTMVDFIIFLFFHSYSCTARV